MQPRTTVLHMMRLNQTESPIFVILCVLCFQRQSFLTFIVLPNTRFHPRGPKPLWSCETILMLLAVFSKIAIFDLVLNCTGKLYV